MYYQIESKSHRKLWNFILAFVCVAIGCGVIYYLNITPVSSSVKLTKFTSLSQSKANLVWPNYGSGRVEVIGLDNAIATHGAQSARPIASITKVITALVVLEKKPLSANDDGPGIQLTAADRAIYDQAVANGLAVKDIDIGGTITEKQALQVMLLASAANYAQTLAVWAYGSTDAYVKAANNWLTANGLSKTSVVDSSGLDANDVSTPSDLIKLGKLALKNTALAKIVATKQVTVAGAGAVYNGNRLLGKLGVTGIKTGLTGDAGACLLFSSTIKVGDQNLTIIGSLLGGDDSAQVANDVADLLASVQKNIHLVKLFSKGQEFASYKNVFGHVTKLKTNQNVSAIVWSDTPITFDVKTDIPGGVTATVGDKTFHQQLVTSS